MKRVIIILLVTITLTSFRNAAFITAANHQQPSADILAGTWKHQNGNEVFIVSISRVPDGYRGHYKKIRVDACGTQIAEIYNSDKPIGNTTTNWPYVIYAGNISPNYSIRASIDDNTVINTPNAGGFIEGTLNMKVLNPNCFTPPTNACPLQAQWAVKQDAGLQNAADPPFSVPTDIILTKQ